MLVTMKMSWAMFRRKRVQNILIGLILLLTATLLYVGLSVASQSSPYQKMFVRANASHSLYILSPQVNDINKSQEFFENCDEVSGVQFQKAQMMNIEYTLNGKLETETILLSEFPKGSDIDLLYEAEDRPAVEPKDNEVLINYNYAKGRMLKVGDEMSCSFGDQVFSFVIKGFVVDPEFGNAFMTPDRCIVASDFFEKNNLDYNSVVVGVQFKAYTKEEEQSVHDEYLQAISGESPPIYVDHQSIENSYSIITGIIASVLIAVSVFIFIIVVFVIRGTIRNSILQQYKSIGVKKAIGYTNDQIRASFLWIYLWLGLITGILGVCIGVPIRNKINAGIGYDIQVGLNSGIDIYTLITVVLIGLMIFTFTTFATKQVGRVKPVQSIKYGMPESSLSQDRFRVSRFKKVPLSILLAVKQIRMNKKKSLTTAFTMVILIYVAFLINNVGVTLANGRHFTKYLLGMNIGDFTINSSSDETVKGTLQKVESVEGIENAVFVSNTSNESTQDMDGKKVTIGGQIFYGNAPDDILNLTDGRQPENSREIVITGKLADLIGKSIGDYITLQKEEGEEKLLICGLFNSVSFNSLGYVRMKTDIPDSLSQSNGIYWVYSGNKNVIIGEAEREMKAVLSDSISVARYDSNVKNILSTLEQFPAMVKLLLIVFVIVCGVIILNWTIMDIQHMTRMFGILKATGFGNRMIMKILVLKSVILTVLGLVIGFGLCMLTMNQAMLGVFRLTPFNTIELPVLFDPKGCFILFIMFLFISIIATILPSNKLGKISPKQLIAE